MWTEEGSVLWRPESSPELSAVLNVPVMEEQMVERPPQGACGAWAEALHDKCEVLCEAVAFRGETWTVTEDMGL